MDKVEEAGLLDSMPPPARVSTGWIKRHWSLTPVMELTSYNPDITEELWTILRFVSEVPDEGRRLVQFYTGWTDEGQVTGLYKKVRSFIRQAENYYRAARTLHYRSSALLYYYCFLNLAKAVLSIRGIEYKPDHGLRSKTDPKSTDLVMQFVEVGGEGVFPAFYRQQVMNSLPKGLRLDVKTLLGYVFDVGYQYSVANLGELAVYPQCRARVLFAGKDEGWWTIAVPKTYDFATFPEPNKSIFQSEFEEVDFGLWNARELFNIFAEAYSGYRFCQSRKVLTQVGARESDVPLVSLIGSTEGHFEPKYIEDSFDFTLYSPFPHPNGPLRMTEPLALYLVMFFLGSLVRYRPDYLDDLLETRSAWMLESFVTSVPLTALRAFVSKITDKVYVFNK